MIDMIEFSHGCLRSCSNTLLFEQCFLNFNQENLSCHNYDLATHLYAIF